MGWLDDFKDAAIEIAVPNKVKEFANDPQAAAKSAVNSLVKIVSPPRGNQTAAQIEAGQPGGASLGLGGPAISASVKKYALWVGVAAVGAFFILRKKRK